VTAPEQPQAEAPPTKPSLRARVVRGSFFEIAGYGAQQMLRLGSNLILTRLLFPAAFGLVSLVSVLLTGLIMLSDVAIQQCVIRSERGDEAAFLNTAFTIQVVRGVGLALLMVLFAHPAAWFYREPGLVNLIYIAALQPFFAGLNSTKIFSLRRHLQLGWVNGFELAQTAVTIPITVTLAWLYRSPWPLVAGGVFGAFIYAMASHFLPVPYRNRLGWDKAAAHEINRFGRWVIGSSAATFLGGQADRIIMGRLLGTVWLGIYSVALNLSEMVGAVVNRLIGGVLYPVLSEAGRESGSNISAIYYRLRLRLDAMSMTATGLLAGAGGWIVETLWDHRYADAAWILRILCVRTALALIIGPGETCLTALGHTRFGFLRSLCRLVGASICIPLGWYLGGVRGVMWGAVTAELFTIVAVWPKSRSLGILRFRRELISPTIFLVAFGFGRLVLPWLPRFHVR
jgi:O-antigen/teichoic acid export membrane protein